MRAAHAIIAERGSVVTKKRNCHVYIAGPLEGDGGAPQWINARNAIMAGYEVGAFGGMPFIPHLSMHADMVAPRVRAYWMRWCLAWVAKCDCLYLIPGYSPGATEEVCAAEKLGIPVFESIEKVDEFIKEFKRAANE